MTPRPSERLRSLDGEFGPARLERLIGSGGMAAVYVGHRKDDGSACAVKLLELGRAPKELVTRFEREARIGAMLDHPSLIRAHEAGEHDGFRFMILDFIDGQDLDVLLKEKGRFEWREATKHARALAAALAAAHDRGVIHRDIKPANVFIGKDGRARLGDFGLAIIHGEGPHNETAGQGLKMLIGTPTHMAPEQFRHPSGVDTRADLYSLGCTLFEMLAGERAFDGTSVEVLEEQHDRKDPKSLRKLAPDLPDQLYDIVDRLMAKKAKWRYSSAASLEKDLGLLLAGNLEALDQAAQKRRTTGTARKTTLVVGMSADPTPPKDHSGIRKVLIGLLLTSLFAALLSVVMTFTSDESRYQELCAQGRAAARSGNLDLAESFYARARDILPKRLEALSALELIALRRKRGETGTGAPDKSSPNKSSPGESSTDRNKSSEGAGDGESSGGRSEGSTTGEGARSAGD